jgi:hypothetical protein
MSSTSWGCHLEAASSHTGYEGIFDIILPLLGHVVSTEILPAVVVVVLPSCRKKDCTVQYRDQTYGTTSAFPASHFSSLSSLSPFLTPFSLWLQHELTKTLACYDISAIVNGYPGMQFTNNLSKRRYYLSYEHTQKQNGGNLKC